MPKKLTQDEWIARAIEKHGDRYDYHLVHYTGKDKKVTIICPIHGPFEQIANNHLRGKGCKKCAKNAHLTQAAFIKKAKAVHGDAYDYSRTVFTRNRDKVTIICPIHGPFEQEANSHLMGSGCPTCANAARSLAVSGNSDRVDAIKKTVHERYGVSNVMQVSDIKDKMIESVRARYGVDNYTQTDAYHVRYKSVMLDQYGVAHYSQTAEFREKAEQTQLERYGVPNYTQSDMYHDRLPDILKQSAETKRRRKTFNSSQAEDRMFMVLCDAFGKDDVVRQYSHDSRYPFMCDFYIKSRDLFIERNASWVHGYHWFGSDQEKDDALLRLWNSKHSDYYDHAVNTWTERDVFKRQTAKNHHLNYIVFWNTELLDFYIWVDEGMPNGHDYMNEYSWLKPRDLSISKKRFKKQTAFTFTQTAKTYQGDVFYEREMRLWRDHSLFYKGFPLQMYLYMNRYKYLNKRPSELSDRELLRSFTITGICRAYSSFDADLMNHALDVYKPMKIYDPFAGWGERMLACAHAHVAYTGVDINSKLKSGYDAMIRDLHLKNVSLIIDDALKHRASDDIDMVLTCPPYHDVERYTDIGLENRTYADFLNAWEQIVKSAKQVRFFCFQINQKYKHDLSAIVQRHGFDLVDCLRYSHNKASHLQRKGRTNYKREYEELLVFKKR